MRFSLIPREMRFCDMLDEATGIVSRAADKFLDMVANFDNLSERASDLKDDEVRCDAVIERILTELSKSFITPFDREDIHTLASRLDEILDNMEETAHRIAVFRISQPPSDTVTLARYIVECCGHLEQAVHLSRNLKDHQRIQKHLVEVGRLENEADRIYRNADAALFANSTTDMLALVKMREIYSWLEETVDACKDAANVISEIVIKGS